MEIRIGEINVKEGCKRVAGLNQVPSQPWQDQKTRNTHEQQRTPKAPFDNEPNEPNWHENSASHLDPVTQTGEQSGKPGGTVVAQYPDDGHSREHERSVVESRCSCNLHDRNGEIQRG